MEGYKCIVCGRFVETRILPSNGVCSNKECQDKWYGNPKIDLQNKKFHIYIYHVDAMTKVEIEAHNELEARKEALNMLKVGDGKYSDINESDFKKPDTEYIIINPEHFTLEKEE